MLKQITPSMFPMKGRYWTSKGLEKLYVRIAKKVHKSTPDGCTDDIDALYEQVTARDAARVFIVERNSDFLDVMAFVSHTPKKVKIIKDPMLSGNFDRMLVFTY